MYIISREGAVYIECLLEGAVYIEYLFCVTKRSFLESTIFNHQQVIKSPDLME